ncbi:ProQ/FinO family protein [Cupriavidus basilensis]|uniref:ProQ/FinO family protein n=1 Tax=Cupriavidus basilensis TaxID=68895 RepID=UPI001F2C6BD1|nr:ProQ/FinO family protein [Cupriavidus basilensis]
MPKKRFPQPFSKNPAPKVPLKIGIFADLVQHAQELALIEAELREAIRTWCHGTRYWTCLAEGPSRVDGGLAHDRPAGRPALRA